MPWTLIDTDWSEKAGAFLSASPDAAEAGLKGLREYLALRHDLTLSEAGEAIDSWLDAQRPELARAA